VESNLASPGRAFRSDAYGDDRRSPRRICRVRAVVDVTGGPSLPAVTVDIGRDGMAVLLPRPLPDGTACRVAFSLFSGGSVQRIELNARASNSIFVRDDVRVGLAFTGVMPAVGNLLAEFVNFGKR
jgi:hypothetical protein